MLDHSSIFLNQNCIIRWKTHLKKEGYKLYLLIKYRDYLFFRRMSKSNTEICKMQGFGLKVR